MAEGAWTPWSCGNLRLPGGRRLRQKQAGRVCISMVTVTFGVKTERAGQGSEGPAQPSV